MAESGHRRSGLHRRERQCHSRVQASSLTAVEKNGFAMDIRHRNVAEALTSGRLGLIDWINAHGWWRAKPDSPVGVRQGKRCGGLFSMPPSPCEIGVEASKGSLYLVISWRSRCWQNAQTLILIFRVDSGWEFGERIQNAEYGLSYGHRDSM